MAVVSASLFVWAPLQGYLQYIRGLPLNDSPELFGLHDNADITFAQNETFALLGTITQLQPKTLTVGGRSREEVGDPIPSVLWQPVPGMGSEHKHQLSAAATLPAGCQQGHCQTAISSLPPADMAERILTHLLLLYSSWRKLPGRSWQRFLTP